MGLSCDAGRTWQLLDLGELQHHLAQSLWYQHGQPPLFNALVGLALKAGSAVDGLALHVLLDGLGLLCGVLTWQLALRLEARPVFAWLAGALLIATPGFQLYQHWMFYDLPVTVGILACVLAVRGAAERPTPWRLLGLAASVAGLAWLRSIFHLLWALGLVLAVLAPRDSRSLPRRRLAFALALGLAVAALPFAKNALVFDRFESSSWAGMSAERLTHQFISRAERQRLLDEGRLDAVSVVGPWQPLSAYPPQPPLPAAWADITVLSAPAKLDGQPNFNHFSYLQIARTMQRDALTLVREHPLAYAQAHVSAWLHWLRPASVHPNLARGRQLLRPWLEPFNRWALLEVAQVHLMIVAGALLALVLLLRLAGARSAQAAGLDASARAMVRAAAWTALWLTLLGNTLEHGENYRFRAYIDPLLLAVLALAATEVIRRLRAR